MKVLKCDRCCKVIDVESVQGRKIYISTSRFSSGEYGVLQSVVDLCEDCQGKLDKFYFENMDDLTVSEENEPENPDDNGGENSGEGGDDNTGEPTGNDPEGGD